MVWYYGVWYHGMAIWCIHGLHSIFFPVRTTKCKSGMFRKAGPQLKRSILFFGFSGLALAGSSALADNISASPDIDRPKRGVYLWGDNSKGLISNEGSIVRTPTRVPYFDNKALRALAVSPEYAAAVLANGDVVQWATPSSQSVVLKGKNITQLYMTPLTHSVVALGKDGKIWSWTDNEKPVALSIDGKLGWFEKIVQVRCGVDHVAAITNRGRAFTGFLRHDAEHHGQLGIAAFPHFEPIPVPGILHQVKLIHEPVSQIACGNYHSLFLTDRNELWGAGSNKYGQLMLPYTYKTVKSSVPIKLRDSVSEISAGSFLTYFKQIDGSWFVAGDGEFGQFGTGSFSQCQNVPLRLSLLDNLREYNEALGKVVPVQVQKWAIGGTYTFAQLDNPARDWLLWGSSELGQLGHNKLSKVVKPAPVAKVMVDYNKLGATSFVAGDKISGCFAEES